MKDFLRKLVFVLSFIIVVGLVFYFIFFFGNKILVEGDTDYIVNGLGAFLGAFFAFLFLGITKLIGDFVRRNRMHWNALCKLELLLNEWLDMTYTNIIFVGRLYQDIEGKKVMNPLPISTFKRLELNREALYELYNLDLINDVFKLNRAAHKNSDSLVSVAEIYRELRNATLDNKVDPDSRERGLMSIVEDLKFGEKSLKLLDSKIQVVLAKIQTLRRDESALDWFIRKLSRKTRYPKNFQSKYEKRLKELQLEMEKISQESKGEMDSLHQT